MITTISKRYLEILVVSSLLGFVVLGLTGNLNPYAVPDLVLFVVLVVLLAKKWAATGKPDVDGTTSPEPDYSPRLEQESRR